MQDPTQVPQPLSVIEVGPPRKGHPLLAWLVILLLTALIVWQQGRRPAAEAAGGANRLDLSAFRMQGRYLVGAHQVFGKQVLGDKQMNLLAPLNSGPPEQRLAYAILVGELAGPAEGRAAWERLRKDFADNGVELTAT